MRPVTLIALFVLLLAGCGQKGPLFRPEPNGTLPDAVVYQS